MRIVKDLHDYIIMGVGEANAFVVWFSFSLGFSSKVLATYWVVLSAIFLRSWVAVLLDSVFVMRLAFCRGLSRHEVRISGEI